MRSLASPIGPDERRARAEHARKLMADNSCAAIVITSGSSLPYFSALRWWTSERLFAMVMPAKREPFFVCPAFEEGRVREQLATGPFGRDADIRIWQEDDDPYARVAQGFHDRGISSGTIGIEEKTPFVFSSGIAAAAPAAHFVSATPITAGCRMIKSAQEITLMRLASKVTLTAYAAAFTALHDGMTQHDFASLIAAAHERLGFRGAAEVQVGEYSALPHGSIQPQAIRSGAVILIDGGCEVEGYNSDLSRTFVLGRATDEMKHVFATVQQAQQAALAAAKPGVACGSVDAAARSVIDRAGFGPGYKCFTHRAGHGIGLDGHEWPYLVRGNRTPLRVNMVFSDEPGIYQTGKYGVRLEDDMYITEQGAELFTLPSPSLEEPFANAPSVRE